MATGAERPALYFYADDDIESVILSGDESSVSSQHDTIITDDNLDDMVDSPQVEGDEKDETEVFDFFSSIT